MPTWGAVIAVLLGAAVWWDAHLGMTYGGPTGRDGGLGAPGWALLTVLMWPLAVPFYLRRRRRYL